MTEHRHTGCVLCTLLAVLCFTFFCISACAETADTDKADAIPELVKIADHLYETCYTEDFDWSDTVAPSSSAMSCSGIQNGQYRGRNYDWNYANTDLCVIHAGVSENRPHASVGVADMSFLVNADGSVDYAKLPFVTVDGINDAGVCIQVNVIPYGENGTIDHTETAEDDLRGACVVRYILDYADSVESALKMLMEKDISSEIGTLEEMHWMISGPASTTDNTLKTVIFEVFPDGYHITENFVDEKPIMTNFNVSNFDGTPESVGIGFGYERWQILNEYSDQADSVIGTFDLMEKVYYSKLYDLYGERFWYSEYNGSNLSNYYDDETLKELLGSDAFDFYMNNYGAVYYLPALWDGENNIHGNISKTGIIAPVVNKAMESYKIQNMEDASLWITIHTSVYDLENLTLDIQVRESQDHMHFTIE